MNGLFSRLQFTKYDRADFNKQQHIEQYYLDNAGNAIISIKLANIEDGLSPFSVHGREELSSDLGDYLDRVIYPIPLKHSVTLRFHIEGGSDEQQSVLKRSIQNYYGLMLEDKKEDLKHNLVMIGGLFLVGVVFLVFSYFLGRNETGQLYTDIMNIVGSFALWEAVDFYLLERKNLKLEMYNAAQIATAQVEFEVE
ncbi:MAG: hypothetical protein ACRC5C_15280 [Bacilli bacterium]